jgi:hypothetical protein
MITLRQIERLWNAKTYRKLVAELLRGRPEASVRLEIELGRAVPAAALTLIRLDELAQAHNPLSRKLLNVVLVGQELDGGWGDPMVTAVCLRALLCNQGQGQAIERAMKYLATMQKAEGVWPREPLRRMPADAYTSAFVLMLLGDHPHFRDAVRLSDAIDWFAHNAATLDAETARLWDRASLRCRARTVDASHLAVWS